MKKDSEFKKSLGQKIGEGAFRTVYMNKHNQNRVIKVAKNKERVNGLCDNWTEYILWSKGIKKSKHNKYFAQVFAISESGKYLEMEYINGIGRAKTKCKIPEFAHDVYSGGTNIGVINNTPIISDYGIVCLKNIIDKTKFKKV